MPNNEIVARILSIVADEQGYLASILSAEADKAAASAALITPLTFEGEDPNVVLNKALTIEQTVIGVIDAVAIKEFAIAAKVAAVLGRPTAPVALTLGICNTGSAGC